MSRTKGTFSLTSNIEPKFGAPLDARTIVKLLADLTASNTFEYPYKGMKVFVEENNKSYTLVGSDPTVSTNWIEDNSGGHIIKNPASTAMTQRSNLQFVDLTVSDDSTNDVTKVENIHVIQSESELDNLPDGLYMLDDDEGTVLDASAVGYDNTDSGLEATNVKDAIDEVVEALDDKIDISTKGVANGVAELDENGKVPSSQLPSYVDDVIEVADYDHLPATGETGKIYVTLDTNKTYRWGGTEYVEISESLALGETSSTAYRGDRGKTAYDHSQLTSGNPHNVTKSDIGLGNVDNTSDSTKKTNFTGSIASGNTGFTTGGDVYTALGSKADKVSSATNGNLAGLNGSGNLTDSGWNGAKDTTSISGNPISIPNLKANQLAVNPIITLEPIQAGSGTPSPSNIRAISGYDKIEALSCGVNLLDKTKAVANERYNDTGTISYMGSSRSVPIRIKPSTTYYFKNVYGTSQMQPIWWLDASQKYVSYTNVGAGTTASGTATSPANACYVGVNFPSTNIDTVLVSEGQAIDYVPYNKTTSISESLGQTVYGATLDVRTGKARVTRTIADLGDLNWTYDSSSARFYSSSLSNVGGELFYNNEFFKNVIFSSYNMAIDSSNNTGFIYKNKILYIYDNRYTDAATFKTAIAGQTVCYELATSIEIQLTPHEIPLLKDYAYVSTNGTSIALDYHNGELASLADVAQLGEMVEKAKSILGDVIVSQTVSTTNFGDIVFRLYGNGMKTITFQNSQLSRNDIVENCIPTMFLPLTTYSGFVSSWNPRYPRMCTLITDGRLAVYAAVNTPSDSGGVSGTVLYI